MLAERLHDREDDFALRRQYGIAVDEVEETVGITLFVRVYAVEVHHLQKRLIVKARHRQIIDLCACCIGEIFDVELEFRLLNLEPSEIIDVLHHEVPHGQIGRRGGAFEHLEEQTLVSSGDVARKLAHLIDLPVIGIFICHGKDFVGVQGRAD